MNPKHLAQVAVIALRNFVLAGNIVSLRWVVNPLQLAAFNAETLILYKNLARARGLPQKNVFDVLDAPNEMSITLGGLHSKSNWFSVLPSYTQDIASLALLCQIVKPQTIFEIGTAKGYTALHLALNSPDTARVLTLDLPRAGTAEPSLVRTAMDDFQIDMYSGPEPYVFENSPVAHKITCLYGDSATFDYSAYHGKVDLFFVDGAHSYAYVRSDTLNALRCCHSGSVIAWHDFGRAGLNGVTRWLKELAGQYQLYAIPGGSLAFMRMP